jgi:hypothetical protein
MAAPYQKPTSRTKNQILLIHTAESSIDIQYLHIPNQRKNSPVLPKTPTNAHGSRLHNAMLAVSTDPRNTKAIGIMRSEETRKRAAAVRDTSQRSIELSSAH